MPVHFSLRDGVRISGKLTRWNRDSLQGTFSARLWTELKPDDIWRIHHQLIQQLPPPETTSENQSPSSPPLTPAGGYANLGRILLLIDQNKRAEKAFRMALRLHPNTQPLIDSARAEVARAHKLRDERARAIEDAKLNTLDPEAKSWPPDPWPILTLDEFRAASLTMRADARTILDRAGLNLSPLESKYFLLYSNLPPAEVKRWANTLDRLVRRLHTLFQLSPRENILWGRPVVFIFTDRDRFDLLEADEFHHLHPAVVSGATHCRGPKSFLVLHRNLRGGDDRDFTALLIHQAVHCFMHRYRTPRRPEAWINEGLALVLADGFASESPLLQRQRAVSLNFIRQGENPAPVLNLSYTDPDWPGPDQLTPTLGWLLTEFMIRENPRAFIQWFNALKQGQSWIPALKEHYQINPQSLLSAFIRYYRVNE